MAPSSESPAEEEQEEDDEKWWQAIRMKQEGRSGAQIEAATGISQTRLSRHLREIGPSAKTLLMIHDKVVELRDGTEAIWEKVADRADEVDSAVEEVKKHLEDVRHARKTAVESIEAGAAPVLAEIKEHLDEVVKAREKAIEASKQALAPLLQRIQDDAEEVRAAKEGAVQQFEEAVAPMLFEVSKVQQEVAAAKATAVDELRQALASEIEEVKRAREGLWRDRDAAIEQVRAAVRSESDAAKAVVSKAMDEAVAKANEEVAHIASMRAAAKRTIESQENAATKMLERATDHVEAAKARLTAGLGPLERHLEEMERTIRVTKLTQERLQAENRRVAEELEKLSIRSDDSLKFLRQVESNWSLKDKEIADWKGALAKAQAEMQRSDEFLHEVSEQTVDVFNRVAAFGAAIQEALLVVAREAHALNDPYVNLARVKAKSLEEVKQAAVKFGQTMAKYWPK